MLVAFRLATLTISLCTGAYSAGALAAGEPPAAAGKTLDSEDRAIANSLAAMVRAGRNVISSSQARINDPDIGDKGLNGKSVLAQTIALYTQATGSDPRQTGAASRPGRLLRAEMDAITEVMDANQAAINAQGTGFKGFIPAVFGRLVSEAFSRRAIGEAEMKITAPVELVRNRRALPDAWEQSVIADKFLRADWPKGEPFAGISDMRGHPAFRIAVPEYYAASCLTCHGQPKGSLDITGYPREGAAEGDLGGVISIVLVH